MLSAAAIIQASTDQHTLISREERRHIGEADYPIDDEFLDMLSRMPPSGGVALGVDRLVMLVCGANDISTVRVDM